MEGSRTMSEGTVMTVTVSDLPIPVKGIVTLRPWNLDAMAAIKMLREFGEDLFPGISEAPVMFWSKSDPPDGRPVDDWVREGFVPVDCGRWIFDHHPHNEFPNACAFTRVLDLLGLKEDKELRPFTRYCVYDDTRNAEYRDAIPLPGTGDFSLGQLVKDVAGTGEDFEESYRWFSLWFDRYIEKQGRFFVDGKEAWEKAVKGSVLVGNDTWKYCAAITDCDRFGPYARSRHGFRAHVIIQVRTDGHFYIASHGRLHAHHLAMLLRLEEQRCRAEDGKAWCTNLGALVSEGVLDAVPQLYFLPTKLRNAGSSLILNGTLRHTGAEPTAIVDFPRGLHDKRSRRERLLDRLVQIVRMWLIGPYSRSSRRIELNDVLVWSNEPPKPREQEKAFPVKIGQNGQATPAPTGSEEVS